MKMNILILILLGVFLVGCDQSPNTCQKYGYSGMVFSKTGTSGGSCSMGVLSPTGHAYMTDNGAKTLSLHIYVKFEDKGKR